MRDRRLKSYDRAGDIIRIHDTYINLCGAIIHTAIADIKRAYSQLRTTKSGRIVGIGALAEPFNFIFNDDDDRFKDVLAIYHIDPDFVYTCRRWAKREIPYTEILELINKGGSNERLVGSNYDCNN